jgi:hypothetical protein
MNIMTQIASAYILMVPCGPKFDLRTSCNPSPALMLTFRASPLRCEQLAEKYNKGGTGGVGAYPGLGFGVEELSSRHAIVRITTERLQNT